MRMNQVGLLLADAFLQRRQQTEIAPCSVPRYTKPQHLATLLLQGCRLFLDEGRESSAFVRCYDKNFHDLFAFYTNPRPLSLNQPQLMEMTTRKATQYTNHRCSRLPQCAIPYAAKSIAKGIAGW